MLKNLRKLKAISVAFLIFVGAGVACGQVEIGELKDVEIEMGCNCSFQSMAEAKKPESEKFLFRAESGTGEAWMNIDGKDTKLTLVKSTEGEQRESGVGHGFYEEYTAKGIKVRIDYVTTWVCPPKDEACEHIKYETTIKVTKGRASKTVKASGYCAC